MKMKMQVDAVCACGVLILAVVGCSEGDAHCDSERAGILCAIARTGINGLQTELEAASYPSSMASSLPSMHALPSSDGTNFRIDWHVGWRWLHALVLTCALPGWRQQRARRLCNADGSGLWGIRLDVGTYCIQCRQQLVLRGYRQPLRARA